MANYNKNIFVGTGGAEAIHKSHFIGAAYGMERMMGHADTPVRRVFNYASEHFLRGLPVVYVQTVVGLNDEGRTLVVVTHSMEVAKVADRVLRIQDGRLVESSV